MSIRIFAGNLAFQVTDEDLKQAFSAFGTVTFSRVILDRDTGKSRGFGFVEMDTDEAGRKALEALNGSELKGRQLRLKEAEPRENRGASGGRRDGPPPQRRDGPRDSARPQRRDGPPRDRGGDPGGASRMGGEGDSQRRRSDARRSSQRRGPGGSDDRSRGSGGGGSGPGGAAAQGRPQEKVRGGAKNRFVHEDDDDDDDINLFERYEDDTSDYDLSSIEGVEIGSDDEEEESGGIRLEINPPSDDEPKKK